MTRSAATTGTSRVNGIDLHHEAHGSGEPLILLHGGLGHSDMFGDLRSRLAEKRQVIGVDLQAHGRTADIDRPIRYERMADDIAALIRHLGLERTDIMGYSLGGGVALRTAIQHPALVKKIVLISTPFAQSGWYPEIDASMKGLDGSAAAEMRETPMYQSYVAVAPRPDDFPRLLDKMGNLMSQGYDWSDEISAMKTPAMLIIGDHDAIPPSHMVRFYELLGGGKQDAGWDGGNMIESRLAILPGLTHYNVFLAPEVADIALPFLSGEDTARKW